jgi:hypothetical protein
MNVATTLEANAQFAEIGEPGMRTLDSPAMSSESLLASYCATGDTCRDAVLGEVEKHIIYNAKLVAFAQHYGFAPRACKTYRAKTEGMVERPCRYIRQDFFLARQIQNLADLNRQLREWLDKVPNACVHSTTDRVVMQHFGEQRPALQAFPAGVFFNGVIQPSVP